jgi:hypothetical protein
LLERIATRIEHAVAHWTAGFGQAQTTVRALFHHPQPTLEVDFLTGFVQAAIIEHMPAQLVAARALLPVAPAAVVRVLGQESHIFTQPRFQSSRLGLALILRRRQVQQRQSGSIGDGLICSRQQTQGNALLRLTVVEASHPGAQLAMVEDGIQAELGDLQPHGRTWSMFRQACLSKCLGRREFDHQMAVL